MSQNFSLDNKNSTISWTGKAAFNAYALTGNLKTKTGDALVDNNTIQKLKVVINMKSLHHKNTDLKYHLKGTDFFEVKTYKTATFTLTKPAIIKGNKVTLIGLMTIKNITKKEEIKATVSLKKKLQINFSSVLDRTKYGVQFNSPSIFKKMKENAIADEFVLKSTLVFD